HELLAAEVERRRRLVEQEHGSLLCERAREHRTLQLAAAERAERPLGEALELEAAQRLRRCLAVAAALAAEVRDVRRAPEEDVLRDRQRRRRLGLLRDEGHEPRDGAPPEPARVPSLDQHLALVGGEARERPQRRGLPRAVGPDQRGPTSTVRTQREPAHGRDGPEPHPEVAGLDHRAAREVRRTIAKNGAPRNAVMTPIGSSAGERTVRATTSARTRKPAPASSESGMTAR